MNKKRASEIALAALIVAFMAIAAARWSAARLNNQAVALINANKPKEAVGLLEKAQWLGFVNAAIARNLSEAREDAQRAVASQGQLNEWEASGEAAGMRSRAAARIERMKAEGWRDDGVSMRETMDVAETMMQMNDYRRAIMVLERALFKEPGNLEIESTIESQEKKAQADEAKHGKSGRAK